MYGPVSSTAETLPRGRHSLSRGAVAADQRSRLLAAAAAVVAECGYAHSTVSLVLARARVSRRTFYEQFGDKDACLLAAYEEAEQHAWQLAATAAAAAGEWPERVAAALGAALDFAASEPAAAHLFTLEARAASPAIARRQRLALDRLATALRAGNRASPGAGDLPSRTERVLVDQVAALAGAYVLSGAAELLPSLAPQLVAHLLTPYREGAWAPTAPTRAASAASRGPT